VKPIRTNASDLVMKALIVYDDFASAAKANATLQRIGHRSKVRVRWIIKPWQVNVLREEMTAENALTDAVDAHLILFAGQRAQSIPLWIHAWLDRWAALREIQDAAVAVINGGYNGGLVTSDSSELAALVLRHGLTFIADEGTAARDAAKLSARPAPDRETRANLGGLTFSM
jgi:hypothetical protein